MSRLSRRDFIRVAALGVGSVTLGRFLAACGPQSTPEILPTPVPPTATPGSALTSIPADTATSTAVPPDLPYLVVTHNGDPETLVQRAVAALGGMERFVTPGARVIVKPNICVATSSYDYAATTNPWVVGALVKLALAAGASSVKVMDFPFSGSAEEAYVDSGIQDQVQAAGGEMVVMSGIKYVSTKIPSGKRLTQTSVYDDILKADVLINVPVAKTHDSSRLTLGMKNLMGVIRNRGALHQDLGQCIADLNSLVKPQLTVIDAVRILTAHGPTGGNLDDVKELDTVVASADVVAADSFAASFFGMKPEDLEFIQCGVNMGLGRSDLSNLKIEEFSV